ncbi:MAG: response regulator transcription factor [Actinomycetia bacterium]|nr:response regulator transcription factor [Actinomycetes bacterium]MCP4843899.1 response regulator transcription factor [Actinomycetes bacterium]
MPGLRSVVIADDDPMLRQIFGDWLRLLRGFDVVAEATSGDEAVEVVQQHMPDLALLDRNMPPGDGVDAARALKASGFGGVVVVMSGDLDAEDAGLPDGCHFISKGDGPAALGDLLDELGFADGPSA